MYQIEIKLYEHQVLVEKVMNFEAKLPAAERELALQTIKYPYVFDFIPFKENMVERDIENAFVKDVRSSWNLEQGFAFVWHQYHLNVGGDDFYIDLCCWCFMVVSHFVCL